MLKSLIPDWLYSSNNETINISNTTYNSIFDDLSEMRHDFFVDGIVLTYNTVVIAVPYIMYELYTDHGTYEFPAVKVKRDQRNKTVFYFTSDRSYFELPSSYRVEAPLQRQDIDAMICDGYIWTKPSMYIGEVSHVEPLRIFGIEEYWYTLHVFVKENNKTMYMSELREVNDVTNEKGDDYRSYINKNDSFRDRVMVTKFMPPDNYEQDESFSQTSLLDL